MIRKIRDILIYREDSFHSAMPSVDRLDDGGLMVAFRRAPDRRLVGKKEVTHVDPNAQLVAVRSMDNGKTWSTETELILAHPWYGCQDPCLIRLNDSSLLCSSYGWTLCTDNHASSLTKSIRIGNYIATGGFFTLSDSEGRNWSEPWAAPVLENQAARDHFGNPLPSFNRGSIVQHESGRLLWAVTRHRSVYPPRSSIELLASDDNGFSWDHICTVAEDEIIGFNESSLLLHKNGALSCFIRTFRFDDHAVLVRSVDGGNSFQQWIDAGWSGNPFHAVELADRSILLVYGYRREPIGIRARLLNHDCSDFRTAEEFIVRNDGGSWDVGYPWAVQLEDGVVLVVYYFNKDDGTRFIAGSFLEIH
jgi:hypothetical protein